jgi:hypothetical protein
VVHRALWPALAVAVGLGLTLALILRPPPPAAPQVAADQPEAAEGAR